MEDFLELLIKLIKRNIPVVITPAVVKEVDKADGHCKVAPIDGSPEIEQVRLRASIIPSAHGILVFPKVDSGVLIAQIDNNENNCCILKVNEIDSMLISIDGVFKLELKDNGDLLFNDGNNKGFVKITELVQKINALENKVNSIISAYNTHNHVETGGTTNTTLSQVTGTLPITAIGDLENAKIKH